MEYKNEKVISITTENKTYESKDINNGEISDGSHTFKELYYHRMVLFSLYCNSHKEIAWKSKLHDDGTMYDGYFIVGVTTPKGNYSYHYELKYWNKFEVKELEHAPKYDGHLPSDIDRLGICQGERAMKFDDILDILSNINRETNNQAFCEVFYDELSFTKTLEIHLYKNGWENQTKIEWLRIIFQYEPESIKKIEKFHESCVKESITYDDLMEILKQYGG